MQKRGFCLIHPDKYKWRGTGPGGCDTHCIPHPCGPCATETGGRMEYERDFVLYKLAIAVEALEHCERAYISVEANRALNKIRSTD